MRKHLLPLFALWLSGCAVGPDYQPPDLEIPDRYSALHSAKPFDAAQEARFWNGFEDPLLAGLIRETLRANHDLRATLARYQRAEALLRGRQRDRLPSAGLTAAASSQRLAAAERSPGNAGGDFELYQAAAVASWEPDLFGRLQRASQAQEARLGAAAAEFSALQIALAGQLATSYFELRGLQQQLDVVRRNVRIQRDSLAIVSARTDAGRSTEFDVLRARAQLATSRAAIPQLQAEIRVRMHRIAVLTGQAPGQLVQQLRPAVQLPDAVPEIPVGSPGSVMRRRPDIREAERLLAASTADIGVATADLFPRFSLDALLGSVALDGSDLFSGAAESRRVTLGIDWTFLNFGRVRARIDAEDADARAALANYEQVVLEALEETENLLVQYRRAQTRTADLKAAAEAAQAASALANTRFEQGYIGYLEVLDAERERLESERSLAQSRTATVLTMVGLYRALAGAPQPSPEIALQDTNGRHQGHR